MFQIPFEWLELAFQCFESSSNSWNWNSSASNPVRMVGIGIRVLRIPFEWLQLAFDGFKSRSNGSKWQSNASNPIWIVGIAIRTPRIPFAIAIRTLRILHKWLELAFERFESRSNGWSWHSNASNPVQMVGVGIRTLRILFE